MKYKDIYCSLKLWSSVNKKTRFSGFIDTMICFYVSFNLFMKLNNDIRCPTHHMKYINIWTHYPMKNTYTWSKYFTKHSQTKYKTHSIYITFLIWISYKTFVKRFCLWRNHINLQFIICYKHFRSHFLIYEWKRQCVIEICTHLKTRLS